MEITDKKIQDLIICEKHITIPPKKSFIDNAGHRKNDMQLSSEDGEVFSVFMRQSHLLPENYSVGIQWHSKELNEIIILLRCNGPHGGNRSVETHFCTHIHSIDSTLINNGNYNAKIVVQTDKYSSFEDAISFFCEYCNIQGAEKHFPFLNNISLFH